MLKTLPGIGDVRAQAIVSYREANGDFVSVDGLLDVKRNWNRDRGQYTRPGDFRMTDIDKQDRKGIDATNY